MASRRKRSSKCTLGLQANVLSLSLSLSLCVCVCSVCVWQPKDVIPNLITAPLHHELKKKKAEADGPPA